jgi:glycosyltransferase involved in cell wall biosynthesis
VAHVQGTQRPSGGLDLSHLDRQDTVAFELETLRETSEEEARATYGPIDVIICTKNSGKTLKPVLERVFQNIPVSYLIIIDGGSTDDTLRIADKYTDKIYFDGGKPLGFARALGLELAETEIVAFIDSDVSIPSNWYKKLIGYFSDPKTTVATGALIYGSNVKPLRKLCEFKYLHKNGINWGLNSALLRRKTIIKIGNVRRDLYSSEDIELYERLKRKGLKWICDNSVISIHSSSIRDYLTHIKWWSRGSARTGLYTIRRIIKVTFKGFFGGIILALKAHPILLLYYPYLSLVWCYSFAKEMKYLASQI